MPDYRYISDIYLLYSTWAMRRNDHRDMDSDGCLRKDACTCNKDDNS